MQAGACLIYAQNLHSDAIVNINKGSVSLGNNGKNGDKRDTLRGGEKSPLLRGVAGHLLSGVKAAV